MRVARSLTHVVQPPPGDLSSMLPAGRYHLYVVGSSECTHSIAASVVRRDKSKWEVSRPILCCVTCVFTQWYAGGGA